MRSFSVFFSQFNELDMKFWGCQKTFKLFAAVGVISIQMVVKTTEKLEIALVEDIKREDEDSAVKKSPC